MRLDYITLFIFIILHFKLTNDATEMVVDGGDHGGYVTSSHLHLTLLSKHHGAVLTCEATNKIVKKRVHKDITLSVRRKLKEIH